MDNGRPLVQPRKAIKSFQPCAPRMSLLQLFTSDGYLTDEATNWMKPVRLQRGGVNVAASPADGNTWQDLCHHMQRVPFHIARNMRVHGVDYYNKYTPPGVPVGHGFDWLLHVRGCLGFSVAPRFSGLPYSCVHTSLTVCIGYVSQREQHLLSNSRSLRDGGLGRLRQSVRGCSRTCSCMCGVLMLFVFCVFLLVAVCVAFVLVAVVLFLFNLCVRWVRRPCLALCHGRPS